VPFILETKENTMSKNTPTLKEMKAELAKLNAFIAKHSEDTKAPKSTGNFGRVIGFRNDKNSDEYGTEYTYMEFVDSNDQPLGSPKGDEEAEAVLKQIKAIRYGATKRGKARFDKGAGAWSIQTEHVPSFVVLGKKAKNGKFTPNK
jgi:peptidoglycan/xylan/chitin deacetylase (PgdA/CDA1 family)